MIKFSVGYQLPEESGQSLVAAVTKYREHVAELYFPWLDFRTCRASLNERDGFVDWSAQETLENDLRTVKDMGIKLDILFNANCYGAEATSVKLANRVSSILEYLDGKIGGVDIATTTSPAIAHVIKASFPKIEVRASVNMKIGTVKGMQYIADLFDSFHMQREYNRDFGRIAELKDWADRNGKKLLLLANSGCMRECSGQIFHDNMVAHESEIAGTRNISGWLPHACWRHLKTRENWVSILQNTWIRPEDIDNYEPYFDTVKLATRMHSNPAMLIHAYASRKHYGNLLDLCEPGFGPALHPWVIDNSKFPSDWFEKSSSCKKQCHNCSYCESVLEKVLVKAGA
ncbi:MAG: hypothetical protein A2X49_05855 [Lentisphaerae bacterium GWF2_52_8]|nr:MAG: hypothetical protein A2X49_05855 [Lentisphaerae bacterium GWF2_52_8]